MLHRSADLAKSHQVGRPESQSGNGKGEREKGVPNRALGCALLPRIDPSGSIGSTPIVHPRETQISQPAYMAPRRTRRNMSSRGRSRFRARKRGASDDRRNKVNRELARFTDTADCARESRDLYSKISVAKWGDSKSEYRNWRLSQLGALTSRKKKRATIRNPHQAL